MRISFQVRIISIISCKHKSSNNKPMIFAALTLDDSPSEASRSSVSPISSDYAIKNNVGGGNGSSKMVKDSSSTFSHDSGVESMNTNSSGRS